MANNVEYTLSLNDLLTGKIIHADEAAHKLEETMKEVAIAVGLAFSVEKVVEFGKEILHTTADFEGFENRIKFASDSTQDAADNMQFLETTIKNLNLPMKETYEGFSDLQAGMQGTEIHGKVLRELFEGISVAASSIHLPKANLERALYDLKEIGEVGVGGRMVRSLQMQFTGINNVVKQTFGKTLTDLQGMNGAEFLAKLGPGLKKYYESGVKNWNESLMAQMNATENSFVELQRKMGEDLKPVYIGVMRAVVSFVDKVKEMWHWIVENKDKLIEFGEVVAALVGPFLIASAVTSGFTLATNLLAGSLELVAAAFDLILANPFVAAIAAIGAAAVYAYHHFAVFRGIVWGLWNAIKEGAAIVTDILKGVGKTIKGVLTFDPKLIAQGAIEVVNTVRETATRIGKAAKEGYEAGVADFNKKTTAAPKEASAQNNKNNNIITHNPEEKVKMQGQKVMNITVNITGGLVKELNVKTTTITEGANKVREIIAEALMGSLRDAQAIGG